MRPINAMGMSKALMEKTLISHSLATTNKCRGNNEIWKRQDLEFSNTVISARLQRIKLTVTEFEMTRFMMSLNDAVRLVLHALTQGQAGYAYVHERRAHD